MGGGCNEAGEAGVSSRAGVSPDNTIMNRVMLRFRPIAPKPATGSGGLPAAEPQGLTGSSGRRKRRYVRVCGTRKGNTTRREKRPSGGGSSEDHKLVSRSDKDDLKTVRLLPSSMSPEKEEGIRDLGPLDLRMAEIGRPRMEAESWVTVLSVTDACMDWGGLGCTDEDKWRNLAEDTCPGFICDADNHVVWSNAAFRRMVGGGGSGEAAAVKVKLALSDESLLLLSPAFACMVRVQYTWRQERAPEGLECLGLRGGGGGERTTVVPCDVWRMNSGGYAWRLDVNAGLSLGWSCVN